MAKPLFLTPDNQAVQVLTKTSSLENQILKGQFSQANLVLDVQISLDGDSFRSDPDLVSFDLTGFTIPNLQVYPNGLPLSYGSHTIKVRTVDSLGNFSAVTTAELNILSPSQIQLLVQAPSGLSVRRGLDRTEIVWARNAEPEVTGYRVYASTEASGPYVLLTQNPITSPSFTQEETAFSQDNTLTYTPQGSQVRAVYTDEDELDNALVTLSDISYDTFNAFDQVRITTTVSAVSAVDYFVFNHNRLDTSLINNAAFSVLSNTEPAYYVITALAFDSTTGEEVESVYSAELVGLPLAITATPVATQTRTFNQVTQDYIRTLLNLNPQISTIPGSAVRDIIIEPFATEAQRLYFLTDFVQRSQSFVTLLALDDADGDGISDPVSDSPYKQALASALGLTPVAIVQDVIDDLFERKAGDMQVFRQGAEPARGNVLFYSTQRPTRDITFQAGIVVTTGSNVIAGTAATLQYRTTQTVTLPFAQVDAYFNAAERRYEISVPIQSTESGQIYNAGANQITRTFGGPSGFLVINPTALGFGQDEESNRSLAERAILAFSSVDAGTGAGYLANTLKTPGVFRASVVQSGDVLMQRDYDDVRGKHIGGKVDVFIQGGSDRTVAENFALGVGILDGIRFLLDSLPSDFIFYTNDPRITPQTPILEVLGGTPTQVAQGYRFTNVSTGQDFLLQGVVILDYNRIQLDPSLAQPNVTFTDVILGAVRFQTQDTYTLQANPVLAIDSVTSQESGLALLAGTDYQLIQDGDPLLEGNSYLDNNRLQILAPPTNAAFFVADERKILLGQTPVSLNKLGVNPISVRVFNLGRTVEYVSPLTTSSSPDYFITQGDTKTPLKITRNPQGQILNGQEVSIDYSHDENFTVSYATPQTLSDVQSNLDQMRHITADVLAKRGERIGVDIEATIVLKKGASKAQVEALLRTKLTQLINGAGLTTPIYQSDVIGAMETVEGVQYAVVPLTRMARSEGSLIVREPLNSDATLLEIAGLSRVYLLNQTFSGPTVLGGNALNLHKGVFKDELPMSLTTSYNTLRQAPNQAIIIGQNGLSIPGYSDDATLITQGFNTVAARQAQRELLTANRVLLSLGLSESVDASTYAVTYAIAKETGSRDIEPGQISYLELDALSLTFVV